MEELGLFALEGVSDKLQRPAKEEQTEGIDPEGMEEEASQGQRERDQNGRDTESVAGAVYRMLVAGGVLRDPLLAGAIAQHG